MRNAAEFAEWLKENHSGKENVIMSRSMKQWGNGRDIRYMVHELRLEGHPICSGQDGYYYAATRSEVRETLTFLQSMEADLMKAIGSLTLSQHQFTK